MNFLDYMGEAKSSKSLNDYRKEIVADLKKVLAKAIEIDSNSQMDTKIPMNDLKDIISKLEIVIKKSDADNKRLKARKNW